MLAPTALALLYLGCCAQGQPPAPPKASPSSEGAVRPLKESLPPNSVWRNMLEHGAKGDGIHRPWMDEMHEQGVKLAALTYEFDWVKGGAGLSNLKNWRLVSTAYFTDYDHLDSQRILDPGQLGDISASGLESRLEAVALEQAKQGIWVEDPGHQHPPRLTGTGYKAVFLADNEWLPVQMFPWFGQYEAGTTPLMHAAMVGDIARINGLLAQGEPVNAVSPGGWTALGWAAAAGSPAAIKALLKGGAAVNLKRRGKGDALVAAVANNRPENVAVLLGAGADPNSRDVEGRSALSIAIRQHYAEVVKLLEQAGARE